MELLIEQGRLADAENLIVQAMVDPEVDGSGLRLFLGPVYALQGRVEEGERVIEASWDRLNETGEGASDRAILLVRLHVHLWREARQVEAMRSFLDQAVRSAPEDDRVWLGKANLAIGAGSHDEAARWLEACVRRRPTDIPVWQARLDWALATHRLADVRQALGRLPVDASAPAHVERLKAWLAAYRDDLTAEKRALGELVAIEPTDFAAIDRLVAIAEKAGEPDRANQLRQQKIEIERLKTRYEKLDGRNQTIRDAREMASLADRLGRRFEAKVFRTIANATDPEHRDEVVPSDQNVVPAYSPPGTLADLLAQELDAANRTTKR